MKKEPKPRGAKSATQNVTARWRRVLAFCGIVLLSTLCGVWWHRAELGIALDGALYDGGVVSRAPRTPEEIVVVGMTEKFVANRHLSFTPRGKLAQLLDIVSSGKPAVIVIDVWLDSFIDGPKTESDDWKLRQSIARAKSRGVAVLLSQPETGDENRSGINAPGQVLPFFAKAATALGKIDFPADGDRVHRDLPQGRNNLEAMPILAAREYSRRAQTSLSSQLVARLARGRTPIDFAGGPGAIRITPAEKLLETPALSLLLQNRIVFVGATFPRSGDWLSSPYDSAHRLGNATVKTRADTDSKMYGVEMLANATFTVLRGAPQRSWQSENARRVLALALLAVCALCVAASFRGALFAFAALVLSFAAAFFLALFSARAPQNFLLFAWPASPFFVSAFLSCALAVAYQQITTARELRYVTGVFGSHVGDEVLEKLRGQAPQPGGETREIAVLFCDIEGFTALSEKLRDDPTKLLQTLNEHFEPLVQALQNRGAFVDNYVGDLVMAIFGAPLSNGSLQSETRRAVLAALDIVRIVEERNAQKIARGETPIQVGVGVHCGQAVVGYLGSSRRIHYTAIGDTVNIASRVESATRKYGAALLVTEDVVKVCREYSREDEATFAAISWQFVAQTQVKGREEAVRLFAPQIETAPDANTSPAENSAPHQTNA